MDQMVWRHVAFGFHNLGEMTTVEFYLDGELVLSSAEGEEQGVDPKYNVYYFSRVHSMAEMFSNVTVIPHSWREGGDYARVDGKFAQLRFYTSYLGAEGIRILHEESTWPSRLAPTLL